MFSLICIKYPHINRQTDEMLFIFNDHNEISQHIAALIHHAILTFIKPICSQKETHRTRRRRTEKEEILLIVEDNS